MAMELKISAPYNEDGAITQIEWNHEELKQELAARVEEYKAMVYTEDQVKVAKTDRANLNKLYKAIDAARKSVKKRCMAPYELFEKQCKELLQIVSEPIALIDDQLQEYEQQRKQEKLAKVREIWDAIPDKPEGLSFEHCFDEKMLNSSVAASSIQNSFQHAIEVFNLNIQMLESIESYGFEAIEVYKKTGDVKLALDRAQEMAAIARRKEEAEKIRQEEEKRRIEAQMASEQAAPEPVKEAADDTEKASAILPRQWINFSAYLSMEDAKALAQFFNSRMIDFKRI